MCFFISEYIVTQNNKKNTIFDKIFFQEIHGKNSKNALFDKKQGDLWNL